MCGVFSGVGVRVVWFLCVICVLWCVFGVCVSGVVYVCVCDVCV